MRLTGGEIVVESLIKHKVPYAIGIPGHGCLGLQDAFIGRTDKISILQPKQEMSAVHMADGYYRVSGRPCAVFTSIGPGAINTAIGLATAYVDGTCVLTLTGDTHTYMSGKGLLQEIERVQPSNFPAIMQPVVKKMWRPGSPDQVPHVMQRAFAEMLGGRRGPVLVDLPMDVQADSADVEIPDPAKRASFGLARPDADSIERAAKLLVGAERPAIIAGGGVLTAGAAAELKALAEYLGIPVATTFQGKSVFPEDHELSAWLPGSKGTTVGNKICANADVLLAVGCRFADETSSSYKQGVSFSIPPTKLIHIDLSESQIGKNYPVEVGVIGDARLSLADLLEAVEERTDPIDFRNTGYFKELQRLRRRWFDHLAKLRDDKREPMMITTLLAKLREFLKRDAIVVSSSGNTQAQILQEFPFYEPGTNLTTGGFSTMGFALPAALGAKLAQPKKQVVCVVGDGDFMMTMQELSTAVQHEIPIVVIVANNCGWQAIADLQIDALGPDRVINTRFETKNGKPYTPHFANIAREFGCKGQRVNKLSGLGPALKAAFASRKPALIEVMVNAEHPYSGSPAVGWWDVPIPTYLKQKRAKYEKERAGEKLD
jgi:acetolactate synthase I/II/III large subunit